MLPSQTRSAAHPGLVSRRSAFQPALKELHSSPPSQDPRLDPPLQSAENSSLFDVQDVPVTAEQEAVPVFPLDTSEERSPKPEDLVLSQRPFADSKPRDSMPGSFDTSMNRRKVGGSQPSSNYSGPPTPGTAGQIKSQVMPPWNPFAPQTNGAPSNGPFFVPLHGSSEAFRPPFATAQPDEYFARQESIASPRGSVSGEYLMSAGSLDNGTRRAAENASDDPVSRISSFIPDLHLLLSQYKETRGQLDIREHLLKKAEAIQGDVIRRKEDHIDTLTKQIDVERRQHEAECNKYRLHIGNLEEKEREYNDRNMEAEHGKRQSHEAQAALEGQRLGIERDRFEMEKHLSEEKNRLLTEFERWKLDAHNSVESARQALVTDHQQTLQDKQATFDQRLAAEKEVMHAEFERKYQELSASFDRERTGFERRLNSAQHQLDHVLNDEERNRLTLDAQRQDLLREREEEIQHFRSDWDEQRARLEREHAQHLEEQHRNLISIQSVMRENFESERAKMMGEIDRLKHGWDEDRDNFQRVVSDLKSVAANLEEEKSRLRRMIEHFGEYTDHKSKGDNFYVDAFTQLYKQILDLAATSFAQFPVTPPPEVLSQIPPTFPQFLSNTPPSCDLRKAYIVHLMSNILTVRVFKPFLFTLGHHNDRTSGYLGSISFQLRLKSRRKEAIWRQHLLSTAYTSGDAKQRFNIAAADVVDEILNAIKYFTVPNEWEVVRIALRRIVKLAVETWRVARLEREMVIASMPPADVVEEYSQAKGLWIPQSFPLTAHSIVVSSPGQITPGRPLLRLFPSIEREPMHESFHLNPEDSQDRGCIYSPGVAIYSDSPPVVTRRQELQVTSIPPILMPARPASTQQPPLAPVIRPPRHFSPILPPPPPGYESQQMMNQATQSRPISRVSRASASIASPPSRAASEPGSGIATPIADTPQQSRVATSEPLVEHTVHSPGFAPPPAAHLPEVDQPRRYIPAVSEKVQVGRSNSPVGSQDGSFATTLDEGSRSSSPVSQRSTGGVVNGFSRGRFMRGTRGSMARMESARMASSRGRGRPGWGTRRIFSTG